MSHIITVTSSNTLIYFLTKWKVYSASTTMKWQRKRPQMKVEKKFFCSKKEETCYLQFIIPAWKCRHGFMDVEIGSAWLTIGSKEGKEWSTSKWYLFLSRVKAHFVIVFVQASSADWISILCSATLKIVQGVVLLFELIWKVPDILLSLLCHDIFWKLALLTYQVFTAWYRNTNPPRQRSVSAAATCGTILARCLYVHKMVT